MNAATLSSNATSNDATTKKDKIKDGIITDIHSDCPPCDTEDCPNYCGIGETILELKGGTCNRLGISEGDEVLF